MAKRGRPPGTKTGPHKGSLAYTLNRMNIGDRIYTTTRDAQVQCVVCRGEMTPKRFSTRKMVAVPKTWKGDWVEIVEVTRQQ
jgi:hypothetical protein